MERSFEARADLVYHLQPDFIIGYRPPSIGAEVFHTETVNLSTGDQLITERPVSDKGPIRYSRPVDGVLFEHALKDDRPKATSRSVAWVGDSGNRHFEARLPMGPNMLMAKYRGPTLTKVHIGPRPQLQEIPEIVEAKKAPLDDNVRGLALLHSLLGHEILSPLTQGLEFTHDVLQRGTQVLHSIINSKRSLRKVTSVIKDALKPIEAQLGEIESEAFKGTLLNRFCEGMPDDVLSSVDRCLWDYTTEAVLENTVYELLRRHYLERNKLSLQGVALEFIGGNRVNLVAPRYSLKGEPSQLTVPMLPQQAFPYDGRSYAYYFPNADVPQGDPIFVEFRVVSPDSHGKRTTDYARLPSWFNYAMAKKALLTGTQDEKQALLDLFVVPEHLDLWERFG